MVPKMTKTLWKQQLGLVRAAVKESYRGVAKIEVGMRVYLGEHGPDHFFNTASEWQKNSDLGDFVKLGEMRLEDMNDGICVLDLYVYTYYTFGEYQLDSNEDAVFFNGQFIGCAGDWTRSERINKRIEEMAAAVKS